MLRRSPLPWLLVSLLGGAAPALAAPSPDVVVSASSRWTPGHSRIVTDVILLTPTGLRSTTVPGGIVGDTGMIQFHAREDGASGELEWDPAWAFVRTETAAGTKLHWSSGCVYITPDAAGTTHLEGDQERTILQAVLGHWESQTASCGYLSFVTDPEESIETRLDGKNVIKYREDKWCRPAQDGEEEDCHDASIAGLTTVFFVNTPGESRDGAIRDADIEINGVNFAIAACSAAGDCTSTVSGRTRADLANTMTHEIGHLLGLDHSCWNGQGRHPTDGTGAPAPSCGPQNPPEIVEATMYPTQTDGEVKKASLEQDDIDGFCQAYPTAQDPGTCDRAGGTEKRHSCAIAVGGSGAAGGAGAAGLVLGLGAALAFAARRRRRERFAHAEARCSR